MTTVPKDPDPVVVDPILVTRARASRLAGLGRRVGYGLYALSIVAFAIGLSTGFSGAVSAIATIGIISGSVVLAPAIIAGYAVKAAVRDDLDHGRDIG